MAGRIFPINDFYKYQNLQCQLTLVIQSFVLPCHEQIRVQIYSAQQKREVFGKALTGVTLFQPQLNISHMSHFPTLSPLAKRNMNPHMAKHAYGVYFSPRIRLYESTPGSGPAQGRLCH